MNTTVDAGLYMRLSVEDESNNESTSIQTQRAMLTDYCREKGYRIVDCYVDDGETGTNFERPEFQRMLRDIEAGKINTVICKDLSRFGRNYYEAGMYLDKYFVERKIRFIAIQDNVDSAKGSSGLTVPVINVMNDYYARSISEKTKAAKQTRAKQGMYLGSKAPYQAAKEWLCEPRVPIREEVEKQLYDAAIRGSVDAVYGIGKLYLETDIATAIGYFELAAKQGHSYAEYQLGRIYCFGLGVPQNLEAGIEWLKASADHGNEHAASLLSRVQEGLQNVALNAASGLLCSFANMLQTSGEQNFQKRLRADRKQISKTVQKKQAQGLHHQEEYQGQTMV